LNVHTYRLLEGCRRLSPCVGRIATGLGL